MNYTNGIIRSTHMTGMPSKKRTNDKQITIQFFVDDLKVSHVDEEVIKKKIEKINDKFRTKTQQLNVTKGNVDDYIGLTLDYSHDSYIKITKYDFLQDVLHEVEDWLGFAETA